MTIKEYAYTAWGPFVLGFLELLGGGIFILALLILLKLCIDIAWEILLDIFDYLTKERKGIRKVRLVIFWILLIIYLIFK